jgi:wobble nucleotide-excising tRNase
MGGTPQSSYCIKFGNTEIDAAETGKTGAPSFGTTLSAGDRNTLALAFFLAQASRDPDLARKVVIFDDPFTSLDDFRREMTAKTIVRLGEKTAQVIVLSHDKYFLDAVRGKIKNIRIATSGGNSSISDWDIEREVKEGYLQSHMAVLEFVDGITNDASAMRTALRPLLESYIRYRFPNQIPDGMWLGDMLGIVRGDPNHPLQAVYQDLDDINGYTAPFHHDASLPFNPDEVMTFAKRTLKIVGGN